MAIKYCDIYRDDIRSVTTMGKMYLDGVYHCETLENEVREYGEKIKGSTAIPYNPSGYFMIVRYSNRFKKELPALYSYVSNGQYILDNEGIQFNGILCHGGNTIDDTEGCILCAKTRLNDTTIQNCKEVIDKLIVWIKEQERLGYKVICRVYNKKKS